MRGALDDKNSPSGDYLSQKMEEVEQGELLASNLDEVGSKEESLTIAIQSSVDASGRLRVAREQKKSKLPMNSEELRNKLKLECTTLIMLGSKFRNREWFRELNPNDFSKYVDWLLGEKVYGLQIRRIGGEGTQPLNPPWTVLLRYEQQVRKEAYKQALRQNRRIRDTLEEAMRNSEIKEVHFTSPVALTMSSKQMGLGAAGSRCRLNLRTHTYHPSSDVVVPFSGRYHLPVFISHLLQSLLQSEKIERLVLWYLL